ncbi:MAG: acetylglutamate kinase [Anaerovoracaceae bacterium]|nr:acetylglutamate kinase [Anaerovoracaceae bacterium]
MLHHKKIVDTNAEILAEALPYIQKYYGKTIVVKYGGNAMLTDELEESVIRDIILLNAVGIKVVLVHGGGIEISKVLDKLKKKTKFINGIRCTDQETLDIVEMVLCGKVNKGLVALIHKNKGKAVGLCGCDGGMIQAEKQKHNEELGFVGDIVRINTDIIQASLRDNYIPVIAGMGVDQEGQSYNINGDTAAAAIAGALNAERLIYMSNTRGVLRTKDESSLIELIALEEIPDLIQSGTIYGGMIPKISSCVYGMKNGVASAVIIDGRLRHSILMELFSDKGVGTMLSKGEDKVDNQERTNHDA